MIQTEQIVNLPRIHTDKELKPRMCGHTAPRSVLADALNKLRHNRAAQCPRQTLAGEAATAPLRLHSQGKNAVQHVRRERRGFPRRISRCTVSLCAETAGGECATFQQAWSLHSSRIKGHLADISRSGLSMTLGRSLELGQSLCIKIENPLFNHSLIAVAQVVRQQPDDKGSWTVMCRFAKPLDLEQIEFFGRHLFTARVV
jgi:hypothetical protein